MDQIVKRNEKLAFYKVGNVYKRMRGFTEFSISKNPKEYQRKYIDEENQRNDVVGYNPTISFAFDRFSEDLVHSDMVGVADNESVGADAVRSIMIVDLSQENQTGYSAQLRDFSIIPDAEGNDTDTYTYSGSLKANGQLSFGYAASTDNWLTAEFTAI